MPGYYLIYHFKLKVFKPSAEQFLPEMIDIMWCWGMREKEWIGIQCYPKVLMSPFIENDSGSKSKILGLNKIFGFSLKKCPTLYLSIQKKCHH